MLRCRVLPLEEREVCTNIRRPEGRTQRLSRALVAQSDARPLREKHLLK